MNKKDLINHIGTTAGTTNALAEKTLDTVISSISATLKAGDSISIAGFGSFSVEQRAARAGTNPKNGAAIQIPASIPLCGLQPPRPHDGWCAAARAGTQAHTALGGPFPCADDPRDKPAVPSPLSIRPRHHHEVPTA